jgi:hypothetical protein
MIHFNRLALATFFLLSSKAIASETDTPLKPVHGMHGILESWPGKKIVDCPAPDGDNTAVIFAAGQSNAANTGEYRFRTAYPRNVFNYFRGKCYVAESPLLGAEGEEGEFLTPLADALIAKADYTQVLIVSNAIGSTAVSQWAPGGDLHGYLISSLRDVSRRYTVTHFIWHQGEADAWGKTPQEEYRKRFLAMLASLRDAGMHAPAFIAVASRCFNPAWQPDNAVARAQKGLIDDKETFFGVDSDSMLITGDRKGDECHFSKSGQLKVAKSYWASINYLRRSR